MGQSQSRQSGWFGDSSGWSFPFFSQSPSQDSSDPYGYDLRKNVISTPVYSNDSSDVPAPVPSPPAAGSSPSVFVRPAVGGKTRKVQNDNHNNKTG